MNGNTIYILAFFIGTLVLLFTGAVKAEENNGCLTQEFIVERSPYMEDMMLYKFFDKNKTDQFIGVYNGTLDAEDTKLDPSRFKNSVGAVRKDLLFVVFALYNDHYEGINCEKQSFIMWGHNRSLFAEAVKIIGGPSNTWGKVPDGRKAESLR